MEAIQEYIPDFYVLMDQLDEHPWLFASLASILVGLSGILPLLIIPIDSSATFEDGREYFLCLRYNLVSYFEHATTIFRNSKSSLICFV